MRPGAAPDPVGIAEDDTDGFGPQAQFVGQHLRIHGVVAHAEVLRADKQGHRVVRVGGDLGELAGHAAVVLDIEP